ncbi:ABC transporter ATP-binding protein [Bradyrhizobium sp. NP1]|uniref:ABC transporter ATP-binding protein n=1 Tax=Bradyrhizobium sp. NP1 TaxID=3049772 RepID=UPI0025A51A8B|nr:ABC transporter ATP-binding protein [Bradyrhizobium sp. NP1]WJR79157.1 ABC transporter ATP-binding protein [Bradyrhizobium sp. NP1]
MSLLEIRELVAVYGNVRATHGISVTVEEHEILALVGSNGAGKSSTLKAVMGLVQIASGTIRLDGEDISGRPPYSMARRGIAFSPEGRRVFVETSVHENLLAGAHVLKAAAATERLEQILTYFPRLRERLKQAAGSLSGGEQQMLAIGRALMSRPRLLLLDEPSLGLAPVMVQRIGELIREIQSRERLAVVLAEQNANWALKLADRGLAIEVGRVRFEGASRELRDNAEIRRAFLGA